MNLKQKIILVTTAIAIVITLLSVIGHVTQDQWMWVDDQMRYIGQEFTTRFRNAIVLSVIFLIGGGIIFVLAAKKKS